MVHDFYNMRRFWLKEAKPNAAHLALAHLEEANGSEVLTVTQNIDWLHEAAGTHHLIDMHGELGRALCARCGTNSPVAAEPLTRRPAALSATKRASCARTWCGSARCRGRWSASMKRSAIATSSFRSARAGWAVSGRWSSVAEAASEGAHTVELNLDPSEGASLFAETHYGPATEIVPAFVEKLLSA